MGELKIKIPEKSIFNQNEVEKITKLNPRVILYWENEFKCFKPVIEGNGKKIYTKQDVEKIFFIKQLFVIERKKKDEVKQLLDAKSSKEIVKTDTKQIKVKKPLNIDKKDEVNKVNQKIIKQKSRNKQPSNNQKKKTEELLGKEKKNVAKINTQKADLNQKKRNNKIITIKYELQELLTIINKNDKNIT